MGDHGSVAALQLPPDGRPVCFTDVGITGQCAALLARGRPGERIVGPDLAHYHGFLTVPTR